MASTMSHKMSQNVSKYLEKECAWYENFLKENERSL